MTKIKNVMQEKKLKTLPHFTSEDEEREFGPRMIVESMSIGQSPKW